MHIIEKTDKSITFVSNGLLYEAYFDDDKVTRCYQRLDQIANEWIVVDFGQLSTSVQINIWKEIRDES